MSPVDEMRDGRARRVAVVTYHSSPLAQPGRGDAGGMTVYVRELARAMAERGVATDILTRATSIEDRPVELGPKVRVIPVEAGPLEPLPKETLSPFLKDFTSAVRALSTSQRIHYDVVHSHYWQSGLAGMDLASGWDVPFVHSNHTLGKVKNGALAPGERPEPDLRIRGEEEVIAAADALIASTADEHAHLAGLYGASEARLKILPPGVDQQVFRPGNRTQARRLLGLDGRPVILYVGRIQPLKGLELAIRAQEQLVHALEVPPVLLVVGGPSGSQGNAELARSRSLAHDLNLDDHIRFMGHQAHERLPFFYAACDVVVICSYSESFGFAALEAHACGRPVVGTPVGGLSHLVTSGVSGYLVPDREPANFAGALKTLLTDPALARSFGDAGRRAASAFTWETTARSLLDLYDCLIETRSPELCSC